MYANFGKFVLQITCVMKKNLILVALFLGLFLVYGCEDKEVKQISKEGSIETIMNVEHLNDKYDVIITTHQVWIKNELKKKIIYKDTIPALGNITQIVEKKDTVSKSVSYKKDFEIYITVK
jgi:hypothetical protein